MRNAAIGLLVLGVFAIGFSSIARRDSVGADPPPRSPAETPAVQAWGSPMAAAGNLMAFSSDADKNVNQITLIDAKERVMSVYHIDKSSGEIELKSVRNVRWDLLMEEYNGIRPLPREIRALLEQR